MQITDLQIAQTAMSIYNHSLPVSYWSYLDPGSNPARIYWAIKEYPDFQILVFQGSESVEDWLADFRAFPTIWEDPDIGSVHLGFFQGLRDIWAVSRTLITKPWIVTGHSLGAARAALFAAIGVVEKLPPWALINFGEPKPGFPTFANIISKTNTIVRSYCNADGSGHDPVTDVPITIPPLFNFVHSCNPRSLLYVSQSPPTNDIMDVLAYHHDPLYLEAVAKQDPMPFILV